MSVIHVYPVEDEQEHEVEQSSEPFTCDCSPRTEEVENGGRVVVHNSYDGREIVEEAERVLKSNPQEQDKSN